MTNEIHFYEYYNEDALSSWNDTRVLILECSDMIKTMQMGLLHTGLFSYGYRIFIHESPEKSYEIVLGDKNERTNREIKQGHNLFKMWVSGEFEEDDEPYCPSATNGDYSPSNPWDAPGMSVKDFI